MIPNAYYNFIKEIIIKTNDGDVKWSKRGDGAYSLKTAKATVEISYYIEMESELSYFYFSYNKVGTNINSSFRVSNEEEGYVLMEKLYRVAQASANNIEGELGDFIKDLSN